jgi:DNA-binding IclR family transcriptional regulator
MELKSIRERGNAIDNEENEEGIRCVGVAVRDHTRRPVAAISVSGRAFRFGRGNIAGIARSLRRAAEALSYVE